MSQKDGKNLSILIEGCISAKKECDISDPICTVKGQCNGMVIVTTTSVDTR